MTASESASRRPGRGSARQSAPIRTPSLVTSGTPANEAMSLRWPSACRKLACVAMSCTTSDVPVCTPAASVTCKSRGSGRPII